MRYELYRHIVFLRSLNCRKWSPVQVTVSSPTMADLWVMGRRLILIWGLFVFVHATNAAENFRLPSTVRPKHYHVTIVPDYETLRTFRGKVSIDFEVTARTQQVLLHAGTSLSHFSLQDDVRLINVSDPSSSKSMKVTNKVNYPDTEVIRLETEESLQLKCKYRLEVSFSGEIFAGRRNGFYSAEYRQGNETRRLLLTRFSPIYARHAFPCFEEPGFRATFQLTISHPKTLFALSNTRASLIAVQEDGLLKTTFETTPPMTTSSLAWVLTDMESLGGHSLRTLASADVLPALSLAHGLGQQLLDNMKRYTGVAYPLDNLDLLVVPEAGTVSQWGIITAREADLLSDTGILIVARGVVEQWIDNLVTPDWWSEAWIGKGLTTIVQYAILREAQPEWRLIGQIAALETQRALIADASPTTTPLNRGVNSSEEILECLEPDRISKGASILRMVQDTITPDTFYKGLRNYLSNMQMTSSGPEGLWGALTDAAVADDPAGPGRNVQEFVRTWTDNAGYPLVTAIRNYSSGSIEIRQARFTNAGVPATDTDRSWWLPITLMAGNGKLQREIMSPVQTSLTISASNKGWVLLNPDQIGFYRVNYDTTNWLRLARAMSTKSQEGVFSDVTRAMLLDDAFSLASTGHLDYPIAVRVAEAAVRGSRGLAPWITAARHIDHLALYLRGPRSVFDFNRWVRWLVDGAFKDLGFLTTRDHAEDEEPGLGTLRSVVAHLACQAGHPRCATPARHQYLKWLNGDPVDAQTLPVSLCHGAQGPWARPDTLANTLTRMAAAERGPERDAIVQSLGCFSGDDRAQLLHMLVFNGGFSEADLVLVWRSLASSPTGLRITLETLVHQSAAIASTSGLEVFGTTLNDFAASVTNKELLDKMRSLEDTMPPDMPFVKTAVEKAAINVAWAERYAAVAHESMVAPTTDASGVTGLSDSLVPINYKLSLATPTPGNKSSNFDSLVEITVRTTVDTDMLSFHVGKHIQISHLIVTGIQDEDLVNLNFNSSDSDMDFSRPWTDFDEVSEIMSVRLSAPMLADEEYVVQIQFWSRYDVFDKSTEEGLFAMVLPDGVKTVTGTRMEPRFAHHVFPCFDEPQFSATFDIKLIVASSMEAMSVMPVLSTSPAPDGSDDILVEFETTPAIPTHLVNIAIMNPFASFRASTEGDSAGVTVRIRPEAAAGKVGDDVADQATRLLEALQHALDQSKPPEAGLQIVAVPRIQAGPSLGKKLFLIREGDLLVSESSPSEQTLVAFLSMAEALVHSFFGNRVSLETWEDFWVREGLAAYLGAWAVDKANDNRYMASDLLATTRLRRGLAVDAMESAMQLSSSQVHPNTANKGAGVFRMLSELLGETVLLEGLRTVAKSASPKVSVVEVVQSLQRAVVQNKRKLPVSLDELVASWTTLPGHPVVTVTRDYDNGTVNLAQERWQTNMELVDETAAADSVWIVPFDFVVGNPSSDQLVSAPRLGALMSRSSQMNATVPAEDYLLVNANQAGFYRVNYDSRNWQLLVRAAHAGSLSCMQKAGLLDDALALTRSGRLSVETVLDLLLAVTAPDPASSTTTSTASTSPELCLPGWLAASRALDILGHLTRQDSGHRDNFKRVVANKLTRRAMAELGWRPQPGETWERGLLRAVVTEAACAAGDEVCLEEARVAVKELESASSEGGLLGVDPNVLTATICLKMRNSPKSMDVVDIAFRITSSEDASLRKAYIGGMGCLSDELLRNIMVTATADASAVDVSDVVAMFESFMDKSDSSLDEVVTYVVDEFQSMWDMFPFTESVLMSIAERIHSQSQYDKLSSLAAGANVPRAVSAAVRRGASSLAWSEAARPLLVNWVNYQLDPTTSPTWTTSTAPTRAPSPQTRPPSPQTRPPSPQTRPPSPQTRPPSPQTRPPSPQTRPPSTTPKATTPQPNHSISAASASLALVLASSLVLLLAVH